MHILLKLTKLIELFNDLAGQMGRNIAVGAMGLMVVIILAQVFFRYVLNNALSWPDEAARFLMLWLTGLMGPVAMRRGGMVAINGFRDLLPGIFLQLMIFCLLIVSALVLVVAMRLGWDHVTSGWLFASSSLKVPLHFLGMKTFKIKLAWTYMSLFVGFSLMFIVNIELLMRNILTMLGRGHNLKPLEPEQPVGVD